VKKYLDFILIAILFMIVLWFLVAGMWYVVLWSFNFPILFEWKQVIGILIMIFMCTTSRIKFNED